MADTIRFMVDSSIEDKTILDVLIEARLILEDANRWTRGSVARTANGTPVSVLHPDAVSWCLTGAIEYCTSDLIKVWDATARLEEMAHALIGGGEARFDLPYLNDVLGYEVTLRILDLTIEDFKGT